MAESTKGQLNRKNIRLDIELNLKRYCPNTISKMANLIAYDYNLSPSTLKYDYLPMWIDKGILIPVGNGFYDVNPNKEKTVAEPESFIDSVKQKQKKEKVKKASTSVMANCQQCGKLINTAKQNYFLNEGKIFCNEEHYELFNKPQDEAELHE